MYFLILSVGMGSLLCPFPLMGFIVGKLLRSPFELIPDGDAMGLGFVQHLAGVFRETGGHSVSLPGLEKGNILT